MNNIRKKLLNLMIIGALAISSSIIVSAEDTATNTNQVFPEEQVEQIINEIKEKPIYSDKNIDGSFSKIQTYSSGTYPTRSGMILVTADKYKGLIPTGHAAIVWVTSTVVESLSDGVTTGPNDWNTSKKTCYGVTVRGTSTKEDDEASNWCYKQIGKPYNYNYLNVNTRSKFYCSQLVWAAFKDNYGINLNTDDFGAAIHPMEIVNSPKAQLIYSKN